MSNENQTELGTLLRLAWPMMLTQLFIMGTGFLDTAMAGHYSKVDLAGVAMAGNVLWPAFMLLGGVSMALTPIVSQLRGAGNTGDSGVRIRQGLWLTVLTSTLLVLVLLNARVFFDFFKVELAIITIAMDYLHAAVWGAPALMFYVALRNVCDGLGKTQPAMFIAGAVLPLNALLNYVFIFGKFGFPQLGGVGCGWATAIVLWTQLGAMMFVIRRPFFRASGLFERFDWPHFDGMLGIARIGVPIGFTVFIGMVVYSMIGLYIGRLGVNDFAAHSIAGNLNWLTYVIPLGLGAAASIRVGFYTGANDLPMARSAAAIAYRFALVYGVAVSVLVVVFRTQLVGVYTSDPEVISIAVTLMLFIAVYQIFDDTQAVAVGALRGYKDTLVPASLELLGYWLIALPVGYAIANGWGPFEARGVYGYWTGLTLGICVVAIANGTRLWLTSRNDERVQRLAAT